LRYAYRALGQTAAADLAEEAYRTALKERTGEE
jgi:hypothetical protein